jgi:uncharacterized Ntn-hydrolase superfamily protein
MQTIATFSIVAYDPARDEWGVAVQSKFLAAAAVVSWARAGAGAVATQAHANMSYGPRGLDLLATGLSAPAVGEQLVASDEGRQTRQLGIVDSQGVAWAFTGAECHAWAGHVVGEGYACQGNILVPGTVEAMAQAFEAARGGVGELADWLVRALEAGQAAGGDSRGRQAAGVLVVRHSGSYGGATDRYIDLRVDDHREPIDKLAELLSMHHLYFGVANPADVAPMAEVARDLQRVLAVTEDYRGEPHGQFDGATREALMALVSRENLEERWYGDAESIDRVVVDYLRRRFAVGREE